MERENVPVVYPQHKDVHEVKCPYCGWDNLFLEKGGKVEIITRERDGFIQHIQHRKEDRKCEHCGKEFIIDFGEDTYTIYNPPKPIGNFQKCLTEYESKWRYNFKIVILNSITGFEADMYTVERENSDCGILLTNPYANDFYKDPLKIIKLCVACDDHELYPNFIG